ncbi:MAG: family 20 glycosylhydrolase [Dysgonamonadaceae bacterium]|jgi:hexosaminidase|nr:family 20 glycosylhydrolase [Dysgonamonadaceae bacterium]
MKISAYFCFCLCLLAACADKTLAPVSLVWEMGQNGIKPSVYSNTFYIANNTKEELKSNWTIYYTGGPHTPLADEDSPLSTERVMATYMKISPTDKYQPIAAGDTLSYTFLIRGSIIKEANAPTSAYIVFYDENGKEYGIQNLPLVIKPFDRPEQWSRPHTKEIPYPDGNYVYAENEIFQTPVALDVYDIFPSMKNIFKRDGELIFTKNIKLAYPAELANEASLLKEKLETMYGCTFSDQGETTVELRENLVAEAPQGVYNLHVNKDGVLINAADSEGILYGCMSLVNIVGNLDQLPASLPCCTINDYPDLHHRGIMLDVCRDFTKKENVMKLIDLLSLYKMNVFHWHLTDDEGWRIEIPDLPELTEIGSRRGHTHDESANLYPAFAWGWNPDDATTLANGYYTRADIIEVLKYAAKRHITVIPEMDIPGHSRAAIKAMNVRYRKYIDTDRAKAEEYLLCDFADTSKYLSAQIFTDNVINVAMPSTYRFVEKIIDEVDKIYQEAGLKLKIFHIGGDEVPRGAWEGSEICTAFMKEHKMTEIRELKDYFLEQVLPMLASRGIQPAGWEEVAMKPGAQANEKFKDSNVLSYCWNTLPDWNGDQVPYLLANAGYPVVLCNVTNFYMDMSYNRHQSEPGLHWGGFVNEFNSYDMLPYDIYRSVRRDMYGKAYNLDSLSKSKLPLKAGAEAQIVGVQGQVWAETIRNFEQVQYYLFPKMYGLIERGWNAVPEWAKTGDDAAYTAAKQKYNAKISENELPRVVSLGVNFRVAQPGIVVKDGKLYANSQIAGAEIRYTTDGSEPTEKSTLWTAPVNCNAAMIKAKAFYLGKESVTTRELRIEN